MPPSFSHPITATHFNPLPTHTHWCYQWELHTLWQPWRWQYIMFMVDLSLPLPSHQELASYQALSHRGKPLTSATSSTVWDWSATPSIPLTSCNCCTPPQCRLVLKSCVHHGVNKLILNTSVCMRVNLSKAAQLLCDSVPLANSRKQGFPVCDQWLYRTPCKSFWRMRRPLYSHRLLHVGVYA